MKTCNRILRAILFGGALASALAAPAIADDNRDELWVMAGTSNEPTLLRDCANGSLVFEIDTGRTLVRRNGGWEEISSGANVRTGRVNLGANGTANVTFNRAFRNPPVITCTAQFDTADPTCGFLLQHHRYGLHAER